MSVEYYTDENGFRVTKVTYSTLCRWLSALPGVTFTFKPRFFWSTTDIRAEFTFADHDFTIVAGAGRELRLSPMDQEPHPAELLQLRDYLASRCRRSARRQAFARSLCSIVVLIGGGVYPLYLMKFDPAISTDPDFRAGAIPVFALVIALIFGVLAADSFRRARLSPRAGASSGIASDPD